MDLFLCDDESNNGKEFFDLLQQNSQVLNSQLPRVFNIFYYLSLGDANAGTNVLNTNFCNTANP